MESLTQQMQYNSKETKFEEFSTWLDSVLKSQNFIEKANTFIKLEVQLKTEPVGEKRSKLVEQLSKIRYEG